VSAFFKNSLPTAHSHCADSRSQFLFARGVHVAAATSTHALARSFIEQQRYCKRRGVIHE
jgi:hypothetical protein